MVSKLLFSVVLEILYYINQNPFVSLQHHLSIPLRQLKAPPFTSPAFYQAPPKSRPMLFGSKISLLMLAQGHCWISVMTQQTKTSVWNISILWTMIKPSLLETLSWRMQEFIGVTLLRGISWALFKLLLMVGLAPFDIWKLKLYIWMLIWDFKTVHNKDCYPEQMHVKWVFWTLTTIYFTSSQLVLPLFPSRARISLQRGKHARKRTVARGNQFCKSPCQSFPWSCFLILENHSPPATSSSLPSVSAWYWRICC